MLTLMSDRRASVVRLRDGRVVGLAMVFVAGCGVAPSQSSPRDATAATDGAAASDGAADVADSGSPGVGFANDIFPTVLSTCAVSGCHDMATQMNHYSNFSTAPLTYARWVGGPGSDFCVSPSELYVEKMVVVPGRPEESFLIEKISSTREEPCNDLHHPRMPPPPRPSLSSGQIELWTRWIAEGAVQN
jgi:hypothetical protein